MNALVALVAGLLFGAGLILSGMTNPANVLAFLDVTGDWRPALAFTMAGAIAVTLPAYALIRRRGSTLRSRVARLATRGRIDLPLLAGSAVFGVGWGLAGICPGPGVVILTTGDRRAFAFVVALIIGTVIGRRFRDRAE
ncbi:MAG: hypothetical protein JSR73_05220 [Proteobacteria bacterium]|nr:hypothetical protein [Pseudomonadota bacterium]